MAAVICPQQVVGVKQIRPSQVDFWNVVVSVDVQRIAGFNAERFQILFRNDGPAKVSLGRSRNISFNSSNTYLLLSGETLVLDSTSEIYAVRDPNAVQDSRIYVIEETY